MARVFRTLAGRVGTEAPEISACKCPTCSASSGPTQQRSAGFAPSPTNESFVERFRRGASSAADRIKETLTSGRPAIGPAPAARISPGAHIPTTAVPPDMNRMIRERKEQ